MFEPEKFEDHYESALADLINQKRAGKVIRPKERPKGENVVDLMDALRKSVGGAADADRRQEAREGILSEEAGGRGAAEVGLGTYGSR